MEDSNDIMTVDSLNTSAATTSSALSVITVVTEIFQKRYTEIDSKKLPLHKLVLHAGYLVDELGSEQGKDEIEYRGEKLQAHNVLWAMLEHAEGCGGERGKRYTATAICACVQDKQWDGLDGPGEETLDALHGLAAIWVSHFLFIFKCRPGSQQLDMTPTEIATLTNLRNQVLRRDGYQCVVSKIADFDHPKYKYSKQLGVPRLHLEACHILHCAAAVCKQKSNQCCQSYQSTVATFNILHNYTNFPDGVMNNLEGVIDHPSNSFLLEFNHYVGFDEFAWCLMVTETPNMYTIKKYNDLSGLRPSEINSTIEFRNHNQELDPGVDLPNPHFIAIHAAIAGILDMSGAGRFFDGLLEKFGDGESSFPVHCWEEFEQMIQLSEVKEQLVQDMANIQI